MTLELEPCLLKPRRSGELHMFVRHNTACKLFVAMISTAAPHGEVLFSIYCQTDFYQTLFQQSTMRAL